jgi:hypothetical protein
MAQAVSRRPLAAEALVRARFIPCGISSGQVFSLGFPVSIIPLGFHIHIIV